MPLRFFHFSGYRPETPWILSKYVAGAPRILLSEQPVLRELCDGYARSLGDAAFDSAAATPYGYNRLPNGVAVSGRMRRIYREAVLAHERRLSPAPPVAFGPGSDDGEALIAWLNEPVEGPAHAPLTRMMAHIWASRSDLQWAFRDPAGAGWPGFSQWMRERGPFEEHVPEALIPPARGLDDGDDEGAEPLHGVNIVGYVRAELGVGQTSRYMIEAAKLAELPYSVARQHQDAVAPGAPVRRERVVGLPVRRQRARHQRRPDHGVPPRRALRHPQEPADRRCLGVGGRRAAAGALGGVLLGRRGVGGQPLRPGGARAPLAGAGRGLPQADRHAADRAVDHPGVARPARGLRLPVRVRPPQRAQARKNPVGVIEAFCQAFRPGEGPTLVIKSINGDRCLTDRERVRFAAAGRTDILLIEDYLTAAQTRALTAMCDCYVSLHRSEGYGLTMSEAMSLGRPVIATGYSGNLDFMDADTALLVPYDEVKVGAGAEPYSPNAVWAEPDLGAAAAYMRKVYDDPGFASDLGRRGQVSVLTKHSLEVTASFLVRARRCRSASGWPRPRSPTRSRSSSSRSKPPRSSPRRTSCSAPPSTPPRASSTRCPTPTHRRGCAPSCRSSAGS